MKAKVIGKTLKNVGRGVADYGLLALSYATPFVPGDVQNYLEERTGHKAEDQTGLSSVIEFVAGLATAVVGPPVIGTSAGILAIIAGGSAVFDAIGRYQMAAYENEPIASIAVEIPYELAKGTYNYLAGKYAEAELELNATAKQKT